MRPKFAIVLATASFKAAGCLTSAGVAIHLWPVASESSFAA